MCLLQEVCAKKHWGVPSYNMAGSSHRTGFLFRVSVCICVDVCMHVNVRVCVEHMYRHVSTFVFMCGHILVLLVLICSISDQPHTHSNICSPNTYAGDHRYRDLPAHHLESQQEKGKGPGSLKGLRSLESNRNRMQYLILQSCKWGHYLIQQFPVLSSRSLFVISSFMSEN